MKLNDVYVCFFYTIFYVLKLGIVMEMYSDRFIFGNYSYFKNGDNVYEMYMKCI